jgi:hypothetical protein
MGSATAVPTAPATPGAIATPPTTATATATTTPASTATTTRVSPGRVFMALLPYLVIIAVFAVAKLHDPVKEAPCLGY